LKKSARVKRSSASKSAATLIYTANDNVMNNATFLKEYLESEEGKTKGE